MAIFLTSKNRLSREEKKMIFSQKTKICATFFAVAFCCVPAVFAQQQNQIAGLAEDVSELRREVARLRTELEELRIENARLMELAQKRINPKDDFAAKISSLRAEMKESVSVLHRTVTTETDAKIKALADMTNRAMDDLAKGVNRAIVANSAASATGTAPAATPTTPLPDDFPGGGIEYTVKSGDTLGKIITQLKSKKNWILYANPGMNPDKIFVGQKIFVPQKD